MHKYAVSVFFRFANVPLFSVVPAVVMTISTEKNEKGEKNGKIEKTENFNSPVINNLV